MTSHHTSTNSLGVQSFDMSRGSLPPDRGSVDTEMFASSARMVTPSSVHQLVSSSRPPMNTQLDAVLMTSGLTKEQTEEIFLLTCKVQTLCGKLALDIIQLSHQEVLFCMGVQSSGYEKATQGHPDCATAYYSLIKSEGEGLSEDKLDEAIECLRKQVAQLGWTPTPYSSVTLWSTRIR